jgi:hypothetical protein
MAVKLTGNVRVYGLVALSAFGCSSTPTEGMSSAAPAEIPNEEFGQIALQLTLPGGQRLGSIGYTVRSRVPANTRTGSYSFPAGTDNSSFVISGIPAGTGYGISVSCVSADGTVTCSGTDVLASDASPGFDITSSSLPVVDVLLTCTVNVEAGAP